MTSVARILPGTSRPALRLSRIRSRGLRSRWRGVHRDDDRKLILVVAGTRPECIKLAPVMRAIEGREGLKAILVNSGQHGSAVRDCFAEFGLRCDVELPELPKLPHLTASHRHLRDELLAVMGRYAPDLVMVQGDTLTAYTAARAARDADCTLAHVEAGLRTDAILEPFPEEWFRRRIARYAQIHFAPSVAAMGNLLAEGVADTAVHPVGNTGIDTLKRWLAESGGMRLPRQNGATVVATLHRRANYDGNTMIVCEALAEVAAAHPGLRVIFPIHPNPRVATIIRRKLGADAAFELTGPMPYKAFIETAAQAALIVSDSGGIQEEAPHLGTPLLVPRCNTERPEALATGFVRLVPVDRVSIVRSALEALQTPRRAAVPIDADAPYGDGEAATRIVRVLEKTLIDEAQA